MCTVRQRVPGKRSLRVIDLSSYYLGSLPLHQREGHTFDLQKPVLHSNKFFAVTTAKNNIQKRVKAVQIVYDGYTVYVRASV